MNKIKEWFQTNLFKSKKNIMFSCIALAVTLLLTILTGVAFYKFSHYEVYFYGKDEGNSNVTAEYKLSDYCEPLKDTAGDATIYEIKGTDEGPSLLVLGGTHPNEPSGQLTAALMLENISVTKGTVYILTETNRSAFTHSHPQEASPFYYTLDTASGAKRTFKFGSRATNTNEQWPNPDIYVHEFSGQKLSTNETRNLNRAYPGKINGTYTEKVAYAITNFINTHDVNVTVDLHEASPEYLTINAIVAHQRCRNTISAAAVGDINDSMSEYNEEIYSHSEALTRNIHDEESPTNLHGLTHRELGDWTNTLAFLCETSNAAQGKYRGAFTEELITYGEENPNYAGDRFYEKSVMLDDGNESTANGMLYARPVCLSERVARHAESIYQIINYYNILVGTASAKEEIIEMFDNRPVLDSKTGAPMGHTLMTPEEIDTVCLDRINDGSFEIEWNDLISEGTVYRSIYSQKVGSLLHDPTSN